MFTTTEEVIDWLSRNDVKNFIVFEKGREDTKLLNNCLLNCSNEEESFDSKKSKLIDTISSYGNGDYIIKQVGNGNSKLCFCLLKVSDKPKNAMMSGYNQQFIGYPQQISDNYISRAEMDAILQKQQSEFNEQRMNERLQRMEQELQEAKKEAKTNGGAMTEFLTKITPFVQPVLSGLLNRRVPTQIGSLDAPQATGNRQKETTEENGVDLDITEEQFNTMCYAIKEWSSKESQWLEILCEIQNFVDNPMYSTVKNIILNK